MIRWISTLAIGWSFAARSSVRTVASWCCASRMTHSGCLTLRQRHCATAVPARTPSTVWTGCSGNRPSGGWQATRMSTTPTVSPSIPSCARSWVAGLLMPSGLGLANGAVRPRMPLAANDARSDRSSKRPFGQAAGHVGNVGLNGAIWKPRGSALWASPPIPAAMPRSVWLIAAPLRKSREGFHL